MDTVESYADLGRRLWRRGAPTAWGGMHGPACRCLACADLLAILRPNLTVAYGRRKPRTYTDERGWRIGASRLRIPYEEYRARVLDGQRWCYGHHRWESRFDFGTDSRNRDGRARACTEFMAAQTRRQRERRRAS